MRKLILFIALFVLILQSCVITPIAYHPHGGLIIHRNVNRPILNLRKSNRMYWAPVPVKPIKPRR